MGRFACGWHRLAGERDAGDPRRHPDATTDPGGCHGSTLARRTRAVERPPARRRGDDGGGASATEPGRPQRPARLGQRRTGGDEVVDERRRVGPPRDPASARGRTRCAPDRLRARAAAPRPAWSETVRPTASTRTTVGRAPAGAQHVGRAPGGAQQRVVAARPRRGRAPTAPAPARPAASRCGGDAASTAARHRPGQRVAERSRPARAGRAPCAPARPRAPRRRTS